MNNFIASIEDFFQDTWQNILDKGISLLLTPIETVEIIYHYLKGKGEKPDRDEIMFKIADISLDEVSALLKRIKKEAEAATG